MHRGEVLDKLAAPPGPPRSGRGIHIRPTGLWLHIARTYDSAPWTLPGLSFPCGCSEIFYADRPVTRGSRSSPQIGLNVAMTAWMNMAGTS